MYPQSTSNMSLYMCGYLIFDCLCIIGSLIWPYLFCYFATLTTNRIVAIGNAIYDSNWYNYKPQLQKCLILIISRSQKEVHFAGFLMVRCTLAVFGQVWPLFVHAIGMKTFKCVLFLCRSFKHHVRIIWFAGNFSIDKILRHSSGKFACASDNLTKLQLWSFEYKEFRFNIYFSITLF